MTIYNRVSPEKTLELIFYVALIGAPLVLTFTITIDYVFRGKVILVTVFSFSTFFLPIRLGHGN